MSVNTKFWQAALYSCDEGEELLTHTEPDEAIEAYLEGLLSYKQKDVLTELKDALDGDTIRVYAFNKRTLDKDEPAIDPEMILDRIIERLDEEYGGDDMTTTTPAMKAAAEALAAVIREGYDVWQCEKVANMDFDVEQWVKDNRPDWLEEVS